MRKILKEMSWKELIDSDISTKEFIANCNSGKMYTIEEEEKPDLILEALAESLKYTCVHYRDRGERERRRE